MTKNVFVANFSVFCLVNLNTTSVLPERIKDARKPEKPTLGRTSQLKVSAALRVPLVRNACSVPHIPSSHRVRRERVASALFRKRRCATWRINMNYNFDIHKTGGQIKTI